MRPNRLRRNSSAAASASRAFSQRGQRSRKSTAARVPSSSSNAGLTPPSSGYWRSTCAAKEWMVPISIRSSSESTWRPRPRAAVGSPKSSSPPSSSSGSGRRPPRKRPIKERRPSWLGWRISSWSAPDSRIQPSLAARTVKVSARSREGSVPAARRLWRRSRTTRVVLPVPAPASIDDAALMAARSPSTASPPASTPASGARGHGSSGRSSRSRSTCSVRPARPRHARRTTRRG